MSVQGTLTREQVRAVDQIAIERFGIPGIVLMENAGRGCTELLLDRGVSTTSPVCICCGKGNNGGDGFVIARHLEIARVPVEVLIFSAPDDYSGDALTNLRILQKTDVPIHQLSIPKDQPQLRKHLFHGSWIVDALLGTGAQGEVREPFATAIKEMNAAKKPIFAVDVPSGLDCDTGEHGEICVNATLTATFVAPKPGFLTADGKQQCGDIEVVSIGVPQTLLITARDHQENA